MKKKTCIILALVLVFAIVLAGCAARRPLQTPVQPRQNTTGMYNNNRGGVGVNTPTGTGTGIRDTAYGNNTGLGYNRTGYGNYGPGYYGGYGNRGYDTTGYGNTGYGMNTGYGGFGNMGYGYNPGYSGYGYNAGYGGYGYDYRNVGGSNNSANFNFTGMRGTATTQADNIARAVETVPGVDNATAVISGNTAYVGIDMKNTNTGNVANVKSQCAQQVRATNPEINTVYVSADPDFISRIRGIGDSVRNGSPVTGFTTQLTELVRRMTPERQ